MDVKMVAAGSFLIGAGVGVLATKRYFDRKASDLIDREVKTMRDWTNDKIRKMKEDEHTEEVVSMLDEEDIEPETYPDVYRSYVSSAENEHPEDDIPDAPFEIFEEEYESGDEEYYEKEELFLYTGDSVLADSEEDIVDVDETVGRENLEKFLEDETEKTMYIRNPNMDTDYEVTKVMSSYKDTVVGDSR